MDADELVRVANVAYNARDWGALRAIYHPSARIVSVAAGEEMLTRDALMRVLANATSDIVYRASFSRAESIDDGAIVIVGRVRHRIDRGGFQDASYVWLWTLRDGVIFRSVAYGSVAAARQAYASLGVSLGIDDASV